MQIGMPPRIGPTVGPGADLARPSGLARPSFASLLRDQLAPRAGVARVRAAIDSIRIGGVELPRALATALPATRRPVAALAASPVAGDAYQPGGASAADPFGWRALARRVGDGEVASGFGAIFERQIAQESGFYPDVAFGLRRSSAGAEGIAQLIPEFYPGVDRTDPQASLVAGARSMRHYLAVFDGDVRRALASYNAGLGRVRSLINTHGDGWERALPAETRAYLAGIVGDGSPRVAVAGLPEAAVFGGRGPDGVLTSPLERVLATRVSGVRFDLLGVAGAPVLAPAAGRVVGEGRYTDTSSIRLDHGNGWETLFGGLAELLVGGGRDVARGEPIGVLLGSRDSQGQLGFGLALDGLPLAPSQYLLPS